MTDLDATRRQLRDIPDLYAQVGGYLIPGSAPADPDARRPSGTKSRPPIAVDVIDLVRPPKDGWLAWRPGVDDLQYRDQTGWRHGIGGTLWLWNMLLEQEMTDAGYTFQACDSESITAITSWLIMHLEWIAEHHGRAPGAKADPADFTADVQRMYRALQRACGIRPEPVYHCPACSWLIEPRDGKAWWSCTGCRRTWTSAAEIDRLVAQQHDSKTLREVSALLGRPITTLKEWKARGWIAPVGRRRGVDLYSATIVQRVADTVQQGVKRQA